MGCRARRRAEGQLRPVPLCRLLLAGQVKRTQEPINGSIVNTTSESGLYGNAGQANYASAKAGLVAMSLVMARELEKLGVRVNAIAPLAATRLLGTVIPPGEKSEGAHDPMAPSEISPLVVWLSSDLAKDVSGQVFAVSGGRIQRIRGFQPITELDAHEESWTIERLEAERAELLGTTPSWIPPFLPPVE